MNRRSPLSRPPVRVHRAAGFTLIELLTVIAIILVLVGLLLNVAGNANYKSSVARASAEIKATETALESYKADSGAYPRNTDTDSLNAQPNANSTPAAPTNYTTACKYLYQCLSGDTVGTKRYMEFKPGQLSTSTASPTTDTYIIDPFGFAYGYSTANQKAQETANNSNPPAAVDNTKGYNPTFDLWSTAGYSSAGGKSYPNGVNTGAAATNLWAKNW